MSLTAREWLEAIGREYLADFVRAGGAAVKLVVAGDQATRDEIRDELRSTAGQHGFHFAFVDARLTKVHLSARLFHEGARRVDWDALARAFLARLLTDNGYRLPDGPDALHLERIAAHNEVPEPQLRLE